MSWLFKSTVKIWVNWMSGCWEKFVWWCCDVVGGCYNSRIESLQVLLTFDFGLRLGLGLRQQLKFNFRKNTFLQKKQNLSFKIYLWKTIFTTFHKTVICIPWCQKHFALQNISFYICYNFLKCGYEGKGLCLQLMSNISQTLMEFRILWQNIIWNIVINNCKTRFRYLLRLWGILM